MDTMSLSNDGRGWVMTALSGIACVFGASFICIDILVRQFPGKKDWRIQDSDVFLSVSLSLSFGVMLFSALYSMLPSAKLSLIKGGHDPKTASWILIGCFLGGVVGIQIISRVMHHFVPHNVVDCEHHHDDEEAQKEIENEIGGHDHHAHDHDDHHDHNDHAATERPQRKTLRKQSSHRGYASRPETTQRSTSHRSFFHAALTPNTISEDSEQGMLKVRPTLQSRITEVASKLASGKDQSCECDGPCYGFSDVCQTACFKTVNARGGFKIPRATSGLQRPSAMKSATATESTPLLAGIDEERLTRPHTRADAEGCSAPLQELQPIEEPSDDSSATAFVDEDTNSQLHRSHSHDSHASTYDQQQQQPTHHHHVPTNAFLNIGLQTSIAIALHKLPEGFITYATNHANPKLGVSVFLALFIHNITEGFAMALPLYLAINNRLKAMVISFVLGGLSQPLGAAVAAVWFKLAGHSQWAPSESGYGAMFAVTAGIMASVALQLFAESLDLTHSKHLCMIGAFAGMAILGMSSALTA